MNKKRRLVVLSALKRVFLISYRTFSTKTHLFNVSFKPKSNKHDKLLSFHSMHFFVLTSATQRTYLVCSQSS